MGGYSNWARIPFEEIKKMYQTQQNWEKERNKKQVNNSETPKKTIGIDSDAFKMDETTPKQVDV